MTRSKGSGRTSRTGILLNPEPNANYGSSGYCDGVDESGRTCYAGLPEVDRSLAHRM